MCKGENKFQTRLKVDTGFIGYDVAIPADISSKLSLNPTKVESFATPTGSATLYTGDDAQLCLGNESYKISYVIHYNKTPLISITFLKNISEIMIVDFDNNSVIIILK
ncbi:hypothetical protein GFS33_09600 [Sulfolobus sp. E11-6]|nr:hypothetical protein GFS33_09600 [Sulfolobus sp. E11-6]